MSQAFSPYAVPIPGLNMEMSPSETGTGGIFRYLQCSFPKSSTYTLTGATLSDLKLSVFIFTTVL